MCSCVCVCVCVVCVYFRCCIVPYTLCISRIRERVWLRKSTSLIISVMSTETLHLESVLFLILYCIQSDLVQYFHRACVRQSYLKFPLLHSLPFLPTPLAPILTPLSPFHPIPPLPTPPLLPPFPTIYPLTPSPLPFLPYSFRKEYEPLNLSTLQHFIDSGRVDHSQPINMRTLHTAGAVGRIKHGVKLLAGVRLTMCVCVHPLLIRLFCIHPLHIPPHASNLHLFYVYFLQSDVVVIPFLLLLPF